MVIFSVGLDVVMEEMKQKCELLFATSGSNRATLLKTLLATSAAQMTTSEVDDIDQLTQQQETLTQMADKIEGIRGEGDPEEYSSQEHNNK